LVAAAAGVWAVSRLSVLNPSEKLTTVVWPRATSLTSQLYRIPRIMYYLLSKHSI
jgi:hypothetical protein